MTYVWEYESAAAARARKREQFESEAKRFAFRNVSEQALRRRGINPAIATMPSTMFDRPPIKADDLDQIEPKGKKGGSILGDIAGALDDATGFVFGGKVRQPWDALRPLKRLMDAEQRYISQPASKFLYENVTGGNYEDAPGIVKTGLETFTSPSTFLGPGLVGKVGTKVGLRAVSRFASEESLARYLGTNIAGAAGSAVGAEVADELGAPRIVGSFLGAAPAAGAASRFGRKAGARSVEGDVPHPGSMYGYTRKASKFGTTEGDDALRGGGNAYSREADAAARQAATSMQGFYPRWSSDEFFQAQQLDLDALGVESALRGKIDRLRTEYEALPKQSRRRTPLAKDLGRLEAQLFVREAVDRTPHAGAAMDEIAQMIEDRIDAHRSVRRTHRDVAFEAELDRVWEDPALIPLEAIGRVREPVATAVGLFDGVSTAGAIETPAPVLGSMRDEGFRGEQGGMQPGMFTREQTGQTGQMGLEEGLTPGYTPPSAEPSNAVLYHEGPLEDVFKLLPKSGTAGGDNQDWWFSTTPDLATSQGGGRGVLMEFDRAGINAVPSRSKPAAGFVEATGGGEELLLRNSNPPKGSVRAITIKADASVDKVWRTRMRTYAERNGWTKTENADGSVTYTRPAEAAAPGVTGTASEPEFASPPPSAQPRQRQEFPADDGADQAALGNIRLDTRRSVPTEQRPLDPAMAGAGAGGGNTAPPPPPRQPGGGDGTGSPPPRRPQPEPVYSEEALRNLLGGDTMPDATLSRVDEALNAIKRTIGIGVEEEATASTFMRQRKDLRLTADNLANRLSTTAGAAVRSVFKRDELGRIEDLPGRPTVQDVAAKLPLYEPYLSAEQRMVMENLRDELADYKAALDEQGIEFGSRADILGEVELEGIDKVIEGGFYMPRGSYTPASELDKAAKTAPSSNRRGKAGYRKTASFESMVQGLQMGGKYQEFDEALRTYAKRAGEDATDAYIARKFKTLRDAEGKLIGETPHVRLLRQNPAIAKQMESVKRKVVSLQGSVNRLDDKTHRAWSDFLDAPEPDLDDLRESLIGFTITRGNFKGQDFDTAKATLSGLKSEIAALRPAYKAALKKALDTPRGQASIALPNLGQTTTFPDAMANAANKYLRAEAPKGELSGAIRAINALLRGLRATGDLSFVGIQGLLGLVHDPVGYGRAWKAAMRSLTDPDALAKYIDDFDRRAVTTGRPTSKDWNKAGLRTGGADTEYALAAQGEGALRRVGAALGQQPIIKQSNRSFGFFGDALRIELADAAYAAKPGANLAELAQAANLMTGWTKGRFLGDVGEFVQFAPRFFQSQLELVGRAIVDRSATGSQARQALGKLIGAGALTTVLANEALGNPTDLDPTSPNFMRVRVGDDDVSLFGTWDSLMRAMINVGKGDFSYLARTKASPLVQLTWDALTGRTFMGEKALTPNLGQAVAEPERIATFFKSMLPFGVQDLIEDGPGLGSGLGAAGVKSSPTTRAEKVDTLARQAYGVSWEDLGPEQIMALSERYPDRIDDKTARAAAGVAKTLEPYYALEDEVWERVRQRPEFAEYESLDAYTSALEAELVRAGVPMGQIVAHMSRLPVVSAVDAAVRRLRERYRRTHPEVDRTLVRWYGARPVTREALAV